MLSTGGELFSGQGPFWTFIKTFAAIQTYQLDNQPAVDGCLGGGRPAGFATSQGLQGGIPHLRNLQMDSLPQGVMLGRNPGKKGFWLKRTVSAGPWRQA